MQADQKLDSGKARRTMTWKWG